MISSDTKIAIVQFGHKKNEEELQKITKQLAREELAHWYYFDETADREFEIADLKSHYDIVYECIDIENFYEV
jgi:hypothetical protein